MEFADVYGSFGTQVTIVEALDRILPLEDAEISKFMERTYAKRGMEIHTGARFESAKVGKGGVTVTFTDRQGASHSKDVDYVLSAVGRVPNSSGIGLESVGVKVSERGFIVVDELMRTNVPGVYAIGDVAGNQLLAHGLRIRTKIRVGRRRRERRQDLDLYVGAWIREGRAFAHQVASAVDRDRLDLDA